MSDNKEKPRLSAKKRANLRNLDKAREAKRAKQVERHFKAAIKAIKDSESELDEKIEQIKSIIPEMTRDEVTKILNQTKKSDIAAVFLEQMFEAWESAGGMDKIVKMASSDEKQFRWLTDACVKILKADKDGRLAAGAKVEVNIHGLGGESNSQSTAIEVSATHAEET